MTSLRTLIDQYRAQLAPEDLAVADRLRAASLAEQIEFLTLVLVNQASIFTLLTGGPPEPPPC